MTKKMTEDERNKTNTAMKASAIGGVLALQSSLFMWLGIYQVGFFPIWFGVILGIGCVAYAGYLFKKLQDDTFL